ncbi:MAG: helix-turn-helix transcriptional regulator [Candidatus Sumerlaeia bacterium]|nr:helix-turn-helix transcriptional regulator [Candidatus Sumerlaeia bacterium]
MSNKDRRNYSGELPDVLRDLLDGTRSVEEAEAELVANPLELHWDPDFMTERLKADIVEEVLVAMEEIGINKNQLAERLGKSRQWVSRVLNEGDNFTVATVAKLACAVRRQASIHLDRPGSIIWLQNQPNDTPHKKGDAVRDDRWAGVHQSGDTRREPVCLDRLEDEAFAS